MRKECSFDIYVVVYWLCAGSQGYIVHNIGPCKGQSQSQEFYQRIVNHMLKKRVKNDFMFLVRITNIKDYTLY